MRLIFMGTPDFSVPALMALHAAGHDIVAVYSQPPRPAGRGKKDRPTAVHTCALKLGLTVLHPTSLKTADALAEFAAFDADIAVVVAYGLILPQAVLDAPRFGCLNIHASLLPRWRGAAPIHRAIMAGDGETGVAIMQMEAGLDTGPVLIADRTVIGREETTGDLHDRLADMGAKLIVKTVSNLDNLVPIEQGEDGVTYASKIDKAEARIDWSKPATEVDRLIRGLSPFPGAWCEIDGERVKLLRSIIAGGSGAPGQQLGDFRVACGDGAIDVLSAQRPGKRAMTREEFLRGTPLPDSLA